MQTILEIDMQTILEIDMQTILVISIVVNVLLSALVIQMGRTILRCSRIVKNTLNSLKRLR